MPWGQIIGAGLGLVGNFLNQRRQEKRADRHASGVFQGDQANDYFDKVAPDSTQFERIGSPAAGIGSNIGGQRIEADNAALAARTQRENAELQAKTTLAAKQIDADTAIRVAGIQSDAARYGADTSASASRDVAVISSEAQRYVADTGLAGTLAQVDASLARVDVDKLRLRVEVAQDALSHIKNATVRETIARFIDYTGDGKPNPLERAIRGLSGNDARGVAAFAYQYFTDPGARLIPESVGVFFGDAVHQLGNSVPTPDTSRDYNSPSAAGTGKGGINFDAVNRALRHGG